MTRAEACKTSYIVDKNSKNKFILLNYITLLLLRKRKQRSCHGAKHECPHKLDTAQLEPKLVRRNR